MAELLLSPLGPAVVLAIAGMLMRLLVRPQRSSTLALLGILPLGLAMVLLIRLRAAGVFIWQINWRPLVISPLPVAWALDGWNWLSLTLLLLTGASALLLTWRWPGKRTGAFHGLSMLVLAGAAISVVSDNLLALSGAWVATDILLIARARGGRPITGAAPVSLLAGSSLLMFLAVSITGLATVSASLATVVLPAETLLLLLLAAAVRMAVYPLHLWRTPDSVVRDRGTKWLISGVTLTTGAWLVGRLYPLGAAYWLQNPVWLAILTILVLSSGLAAWTGSPQDRFALLTSNRATWLWLAVGLAPTSVGRDVAGWSLMGIVLGLMLLAVGQAIFERWRWRVPLLLAAATLAGLPLTAGMPAYALSSLGNFLLALLLLAANGLALACVALGWESLAETATPAPGQEPMARFSPRGITLNWPIARLLSAFGLAAVPAILWGLQPESLARLAGFGSAPSLGRLLGDLGLTGLLFVALSLVLGTGLSQLLRQPLTNPSLWRPRVAQLTSLSWVLAGLRWGLAWIEAGWRNVLAVFEGEGYVGWLALVAFLAWLIIQP